MSIKLRTVGLVAQNMPKTLNFYRAIGFAIPEDADHEDNVDFETPEGITLGFLSDKLARQADPKFKTPSGQSMNLQFLCKTPSEVDALFASLTKAGHPAYAEPWNAPWGQRFARVQDPDGRIVNFYAFL